MIRQANDQYDTNDHDDEFLAIDEFPAKRIAEETEGELADDVTDICCGVDGATEEERIGWALLAFKATPVPSKE